MTPPDEYDIFTDKPNETDGFTILTFSRYPRYDKITTVGINPPHEIKPEQFIEWRKISMRQADIIKRPAKEILQLSDTIWKPRRCLQTRGVFLPSIGKLIAFTEASFFQGNNNVTCAIYKIPGFAPLVCVWFNNETGKRYA